MLESFIRVKNTLFNLTFLLASVFFSTFISCTEDEKAPIEPINEALGAGGTGFESGYSTAVDGAGNIFVTGSFMGTATFGTTTIQAQGEDIFVAKYNSENELLWVKRAGGPDSDRGMAITLDDSGNSYITGYFTSQANFGSLVVNSIGGSYDSYVAKLNAAGNFEWVRSFGSSNTEMAHAIILDHDGNLVVTGTFFQTMTIGSITTSSNGGSDIFVAKFNKDSGTELWVKNFGGLDDDSGSALGVTSIGDLYVGGSFFGTSTFGSNTFTSGGGLNGCILKLNIDGDLLWAKQIVGSDWNNALGITVDDQDDCFVTGYFTSSATLGGTVLNASGNEDIFLAKYSAAGNVIWATKAGGSDYDYAKAIARDKKGNLYLTGYFSQLAAFDNISVTSSENSRDVFVAKYNNDGSIQWVVTAGGAETDSGQSVAVGKTGIIYVTGFFRDFSINFGITTLENAGGDDIFIWKLLP